MIRAMQMKQSSSQCFSEVNMETKSTSIERKIQDAVQAALKARCCESAAKAIQSINPDDLRLFFHAGLNTSGMQEKPIASGLPASPGAAAGEVVLDAARAIALSDKGHSVILVRPETNPDDILGMQVSGGILTASGGLGSHAAIVARGWGKPAVVGAVDVHVTGDELQINGKSLKEGDFITIDGSSGNIYIGKLDISSHEPPEELNKLLEWADQVMEAGNFEVRVNADTQCDARMGRKLGAKGIGLCRTEHMFLAPERLPLMRKFILSETEEEAQESLRQLEKAQVSDFELVLETMNGLPVKVRLLDPPLHEFLPDIIELSIKEAKGTLTASEAKELAAVRRLHEKNPMIGTRGVRLGVVRGGLYEMQVRALATAAENLIKRGLDPQLEIMIPLVVNEKELALARKWVTDTLEQLGCPDLTEKTIPIGAMIETPRAALVADALTMHSDFFSFGTNDLTQLTFGFSRDDVEANMMPAYKCKGILNENPFAVVDRDGVGALVEIGCAKSRKQKPAIKLSVCGEHAGNPASIGLFVEKGVDSLSCSPFRVPISRLASAQALLSSGRVSAEQARFSFDEAFNEAFNEDEKAAANHEAKPRMCNDADETDIVLQADEDFMLYLLRVRGYITPDGMMGSLGTVPSNLMDDLARRGLVDFMESRRMYTLTEEGAKEQERRFQETVNPSLAKALSAAYKLFLELNTEFKELCNNWQLRDGAPNDHKDCAYDDKQIKALMAINERSKPVIAELAKALPRLARYSIRLNRAARRVASGEIKQFTGVMCESFHDVWMEMHEDLMLQQGIDRAEEGSF